MELWIRSANKDFLIKSEGLYIFQNCNDNELQSYIKDYKYDQTLGIYKSKERALEVLDEIQKLCLKDTIIKTPLEIFRNDNIIYEMPKD